MSAHKDFNFAGIKSVSPEQVATVIGNLGSIPTKNKYEVLQEKLIGHMAVRSLCDMRKGMEYIGDKFDSNKQLIDWIEELKNSALVDKDKMNDFLDSAITLIQEKLDQITMKPWQDATIKGQDNIITIDPSSGSSSGQKFLPE